MTTQSYTTGDDFSGNKFLDTPGEFHMVTEAVQWPPLDNNECEVIDRLFDLKCRVLAGPDGTVGKTTTLKFWKPTQDKPSSKKRIDRCLLALSIADPEDKNKQIEIKLEDFPGRQFFVKLDKNKNGYLNISFSNIFHVDDPEAASYPRDANMIEGIAPALRRKGQGSVETKPNKTKAASGF